MYYSDAVTDYIHVVEVIVKERKFRRLYAESKLRIKIQDMKYRNKN